ncbi:hypothetical protein Scep_029528 [Stephania cephalantha]|uniref:Uncharacterized protein n=1 Tax=Stephania cephalantha TaxID=152367 RepID=A0AAP0E2C5_9MAGN
MDVDYLLNCLKQRVDNSNPVPECVSSKPNMRLTAQGIGAVRGRFLLGTAEKIPSSELVFFFLMKSLFRTC